MSPIQTQRLSIRRWQARDRPALAALLQNQETMRFSLIGPHSDAQIDAWLADSIAQANHPSMLGHWAITLTAQDQALGYIKLVEEDGLTAAHEVELGIRLLPAGWGHGYAHEAADQMIKQLFAQGQKTRVLGVVDPSNNRSITLLKRLGMIYERDISFPGYDYPDHLYALERP